jgi:hypothetical protein
MGKDGVFGLRPFFHNGSPAFAGDEYSLNPSRSISDRNGRKRTEEEGLGAG